MKKEKIIALTDGLLNAAQGKTTHGLIHRSSRFELCAVVDAVSAGRDAGEVVDGKNRNIPVFKDMEQAMAQLPDKPSTCVIGVATHGGRLTPSLKKEIATALRLGLNMVNGLHDFVGEVPEFVALAKEKGVILLDIRKPNVPPKAWEGTIYQVKVPRIAVMGTDCAIGKRTTAVMLHDMCNKNGIRTEMIYTGQSGWMQGFQYGFILDSTLNDFVSGELEQAIVKCVQEAQPELILIEGQSSLRNPSGPCGAEFICSGGATGVILQHVLDRHYYNHGPHSRSRMPSLESEIEIIRLLGATVLGIALSSLCEKDIRQLHGLPVVFPKKEGVEAFLPAIRAFMNHPPRSLYED